MLRRCCWSLCLWVWLSGIAAATEAPSLEGYLPHGGPYDPAVPTPAQILGWEVGTWHVRHDQLVRYAEAVAEASPRVTMLRIGESHEQRPLLLLTVTSPDNQRRIETLRRQHLEAIAGANADQDRPVIVWMGYSVHGNEASGTNASLLFLYHLAASQNVEVRRWLDEAVILIDPCLNPDGGARFAQWVNAHRGHRLVGDPYHLEHREGWPNGRTNHYWFDLNRDWLPLVHPESRARLSQYHRWKPNVLTDYHEMGTNATYFFQPGIPSRRNPLTPEENVSLTGRIAGYHAKALDAKGRRYYTEESFDDFYYGKGSTYPDVNGAVGILFEQSSSRGHLQDSSFGPKRFVESIDNQLTTSLSTVRAAVDLRAELLDYQRRFYAEAAPRQGTRAWLIAEPQDPERIARLIDLLLMHDIQVYALQQPVEREGRRFGAGSAWVVPLDQPQHRLIRALFERPTSFADTAFYDVSAWTLPLAYDVDHVALDAAGLGRASLGEPIAAAPWPAGALKGRSTFAYAFGWSRLGAARAVVRLLEQGWRASFAVRPLIAETDAGTVDFGRGAIVVPVTEQDRDAAALVDALDRIAREERIEIFGLKTGLTERGIDVGSPSLAPLVEPKVALAVGPGASTYASGELWHLADRKLGMAVSLVPSRSLASLPLQRYTHLVLPDGFSPNWSGEALEPLKRWLRQGGVIVAERRAVNWIAREGLVAIELGDDEPDSSKPKKAPPPEPRPYADLGPDRAKQLIAGTIFEVELDRTHPLAFGFSRDRLATFRTGRLRIPPQSNPYGVVARYTDQPLLAGYASAGNVERLAGSELAVVLPAGRGRVVLLTDPPDFRGFWYGTQRLWTNALLFSRAVSFPRSEEDAAVNDEHGHVH